jgi:Cu/Ag efflux protein CusF
MARRMRTLWTFLIFLDCAAALVSCHPQDRPQTRRYVLRGVIVSVDKENHQATISHHRIPGYMEAMTMSYVIKDQAALQQLQPGDEIEADVVVKSDDMAWLENVRIMNKAPAQH